MARAPRWCRLFSLDLLSHPEQFKYGIQGTSAFGKSHCVSWVRQLLRPWWVVQKWAALVDLWDLPLGSPLLPAELFLPLPKGTGPPDRPGEVSDVGPEVGLWHV